MSHVDREIRRIAAELDTFPFEPEQWYWLTEETGRRGMRGNAAGGHAMRTPRRGGAPVYHDIIAEGAFGTRSEVLRVADMLVLGVEPRKRAEMATAHAIYRVALGRLGVVDDVVVSPATLPPDAGDFYHPVRRSFERRQVQLPATFGLLAKLLTQELRAWRKAPGGPKIAEWIATAARLLWRIATAEPGVWIRQAPDEVPCRFCRCRSTTRPVCPWRITGGILVLGCENPTKSQASDAAVGVCIVASEREDAWKSSRG